MEASTDSQGGRGYFSLTNETGQEGRCGQLTAGQSALPQSMEGYEANSTVSKMLPSMWKMCVTKSWMMTESTTSARFQIITNWG